MACFQRDVVVSDTQKALRDDTLGRGYSSQKEMEPVNVRCKHILLSSEASTLYDFSASLLYTFLYVCLLIFTILALHHIFFVRFVQQLGAEDSFIETPKPREKRSKPLRSPQYSRK
ncbi:unnamed protein product [Caenorhabditis auriculariae]|uniref:Uncharacterized protein n=1 Tax=Caenorhabditis auriculariae TaxID=2777116 RepID=A0A8S1HX19_9PELO|nr:unnamed protein product [Caenorhabditis auriculariae]